MEKNCKELIQLYWVKTLWLLNENCGIADGKVFKNFTEFKKELRVYLGDLILSIKLKFVTGCDEE